MPMIGAAGAMGATGATGRELVTQLLAYPGCASVSIFVRKKPDFEHHKLNVHEIDFLKKELDTSRWFDIRYESLSYDPMFVTDRQDFTVKQHLPNKPFGPKTWRNDDYIRSIKE